MSPLPRWERARVRVNGAAMGQGFPRCAGEMSAGQREHPLRYP